MDIEGKIVIKLPEQSGASQKGAWVKQDIVIEQTNELDKKLCISLWGDKVRELAKFSIGDMISIGVNFESREYNGRWYTEARAWKVSLVSSSQQSEELPPMDQVQEQFATPEDDMPF